MKRILLIEDNESNIYLVDFILRKAGYDVVVAKTGEDGIDLASRERFDLILMDIQLPGIDGLEATRRIRDSGESSLMPVVALTSHALIGDSDRAFQAGCTGYIEKPINPDTFIQDIEKQLAVPLSPKRLANDAVRALVVDDSSDEQYLVETLLKEKGYETLGAGNGQEALDILRRERVDVIISDVLMPKMDGFQLCRECKNDDRLRHIPFIFYTATYTDSKAEELGLGIGADRFLIKPQDESVFLRHIEEVVDHYRKNGFVAEKKRPLKTEPVFLAEYNELLVRKLEQKNLELQLNEARLRSLVKILQHDSENIQDFLEFALNEAISLTGSRIGYIYFYDEDKKEFVLNSWSRDVMKECTVMNPQICYELDRTGIWGEAVRQRRPIILNDYLAEHPLKKGYPEGHVQLFRFLTIPVFSGGRIVAVIGVANKETKYHDSDILQLTLLMEGVWKVVGRRKAEEELRIKTEEIERYFTESLDLLCIADMQGHFRRLNPEWEKTLGYDLDELIGKPFLDLVHPDDREATLAAMADLADAKEVFNFVNRYRHRDGSYRWLEWRSYPSGGLIYAIARDITSHRKLEAQLIQSQKMEAVGQLAAGIAHDFNNILGAMVNYVQLLELKSPDSETVREFAGQMLQLTERATGLTQGLLAFSRRQETNLVAADLNGIITRVLKLIQRIIGEDIEIVMHLQEGCCNVMADPLQIEQVLMNLATNARDAMPKGGRLIIATEVQKIDKAFISAHGFGEPGQYMVLTFSDTGGGMDEETRKKIFDPFFTTKEVGKGTGLGLSMVYGIIKQHRGYITVYSEPGRGTTFKIYLPGAGLRTEETKGKAESTEIPLGQGETVLLVEDEEMLRKVTMSILESYGYRVLPAKDGPEAIEVVRSHGKEISLVLLDVIMPKMNGKEVAGEIRKQIPDMPVLFMSGYPERAGHRRQILSDDDECLTKPIAPAVLLRKMRELIVH